MKYGINNSEIIKVKVFKIFKSKSYSLIIIFEMLMSKFGREILSVNYLKIIVFIDFRNLCIL